jgi:hypothetical protein
MWSSFIPKKIPTIYKLRLKQKCNQSSNAPQRTKHSNIMSSKPAKPRSLKGTVTTPRSVEEIRASLVRIHFVRAPFVCHSQYWICVRGNYLTHIPSSPVVLCIPPRCSIYHVLYLRHPCIANVREKQLEKSKRLAAALPVIEPW